MAVEDDPLFNTWDEATKLRNEAEERLARAIFERQSRDQIKLAQIDLLKAESARDEVLQEMLETVQAS